MFEQGVVPERGEVVRRQRAGTVGVVEQVSVLLVDDALIIGGGVFAIVKG